MLRHDRNSVIAVRPTVSRTLATHDAERRQVHRADDQHHRDREQHDQPAGLALRAMSWRSKKSIGMIEVIVP